MENQSLLQRYRKIEETADKAVNERIEFRKAIQDATGVSTHTIVKWMAGTKTPGPENRAKIAKVLNTTTRELFPYAHLKK